MRRRKKNGPTSGPMWRESNSNGFHRRILYFSHQTSSLPLFLPLLLVTATLRLAFIWRPPSDKAFKGIRGADQFTGDLQPLRDSQAFDVIQARQSSFGIREELFKSPCFRPTIDHLAKF